MMTSTYEVGPEILEWLNHNLSPMEASTFYHYRAIRNLTEIVDLAEGGKVSKYAALDAIRHHNSQNCSGITYEEVRDRLDTYVFSDIADWVVYTDDIETSRLLLRLRIDSLNDLADKLPEEVEWLVVWDILSDEILVARSPYTSDRLGEWAYALPPVVESSIGSSSIEEVRFSAGLC